MGLAESQKARRAARRSLMTTVKVADKAVQQPTEMPPAERRQLLEDQIEYLKEALMKWEATQADVELVIPDDQLEADVDEADVVRAEVKDVKRAVTLALKTLGATPEVKSSPSVAGSEGTRLPKLDLPRFGGNVKDWPSFWELFENAVDGTELPEVSKFAYLRTVLDGDAARCIEGLSLTAAHYGKAVALLKERFGREELIIVSHVQSLLNIQVKGSSTETLRELLDKLLADVRSLETLSITGERYGVFLTPIILSKLPEKMRMDWARVSAQKESDLDFLLNFVKVEIESRERSNAFSAAADAPTRKTEERRTTGKATVSALQTPSRTGCGVCRGTHRTDKCWTLRDGTLEERRTMLREAGLCFACLGPDHRANACQHRCSDCGKRHHRLLCAPPPPGAAAPDTSTTPTPSLHAVNPGGCSASLQTASISVVCPDGRRVTATALLDSGADRSYVTSSLVRKVKPHFVSRTDIRYAPFGCNQPSQLNSYMFSLDLCPVDVHEIDECTRLTFTEVPSICTPLRRQRIPPSELHKLGGRPLSDAFDHDRQLKVDLLIGLDHYWSVMSGRAIRLSYGLVAQESLFGWVVSGSYPCNEHQVSVSASCPSLVSLNVTDAAARAMWELDCIGIAPHEHGDGNDVILKQFESTVRYDGERYEVALPWNGKEIDLLDNRRSAESRLNGLCMKLRRDPSLLVGYQCALNEFERLEFVEPVATSDVSSCPVFYLPHRPVVRESSSTTKIRPVFDASARDRNGLSLIDCLNAGPSLLPSMVDVLLRFRRHAVALTADISKAFLQIRIREEDRDAHRYLTYDDEGKMKVMRFERVPFGNKSSPFLLNATIRHHLARQNPTAVVEELRANLYVDDWLSGADTSEQATQMFTEAREIMAKAGMQLSKWSSNEYSLVHMIHQSSGEHLLSESGAILGMRWSPDSDSFSFAGFSVPVDVFPTKRFVLSCIARLYDPLGFATPFAMQAKILFQDVWRLGLGWDEALPSDQARIFQAWVEGLPCLRSWLIPRRLSVEVTWSELEGVELHAFCDASERGYGTAVYLRFSCKGSFSTSLIMSRARVAPVKRVTLPRLELLGALLAARVVVTVMNALHLPSSTPIRCWTDSMVALSWIKGDPNRWKPFVSNRVCEIHDLLDPSCWQHIPGSMNPADLLTRGISAQALVQSSMWLRGPDFTELSQHQPPVDTSAVVTSLSESCLVSADSISPSAPLIEFPRFSSLQKLTRSVAWILRFATNARTAADQRKRNELDSSELRAAEQVIIKQEQSEAFADDLSRLRSDLPVAKQSSLMTLSPFLDEEGILRVKGRLEQSHLTYDAKHPVIVPSGHLALLIVRSQHVALKHAGVSALMAAVRARFWIVGLRRLAKRVKRECLSCQRIDVLPCTQSPAPLPAARVQPSAPFSVIGLDYAGPLYCADHPEVKYYLLLITCAVVRAIHLELTESLSLDDFIMAFRRFCARRGCPSIIYSDNARTFKGAAARLSSLFPSATPEWRFIVPASPWWGGFWERLVRSVKTCLKKALGRRVLMRTELETVLTEIEGCLNSRPLTTVNSDEPEQLLTPAHFLLGRMVNELVRYEEVSAPLDNADLNALYGARADALRRFWSLWSETYLKALPPLVSRFRTRGAPKVGSLVLVKDHTTPRFKWPVGVIVDTHRGRDGLIRSFKVRVGNKTMVRSIQCLHDLEVSILEK